MHSRDFLMEFQHFGATFSLSDGDQRALRLREAGLLPRGARGPHAPHLAVQHMANLLIGLTASETAPGAADAVAVYSGLPAVGDRFADAETLEAALVALFADYETVVEVEAVVICRSWPEATIITRSGESFSFVDPNFRKTHRHANRSEYRVGWQFFHQINANIAIEAGPGPSKAHFEWVKKVVKIGNEQGQEAADQYMKENPFQE